MPDARLPWRHCIATIDSTTQSHPPSDDMTLLDALAWSERAPGAGQHIGDATSTMRRRAPARAVSSYAVHRGARAAPPLREQQARENARQGAQGSITRWTHRGSAIAPDYPYTSDSGHDLDANPAVVRGPSRTEGVTTTALAPRTRADTNAGIGTVDDVRLASRQQRVRAPGSHDAGDHVAPELSSHGAGFGRGRGRRSFHAEGAATRLDRSR
jgi:hypothetical protein